MSTASLVCVGAIAAIGAFAQNPDQLPRFEVASIRPSTLNDGSSRNDFSGPNVVFRNYVLRGILQAAFDVEQIGLEAPAWLSDERFDITAKVPDEKATLAQRQQMLQALLIDRFGLVFHRETRMRAGFALVVGKNGPKIHPVADEGGHSNNSRPGKMERLRTTIDDFASTLAESLRQPVIDETHLEGRYDVVLTYAPDSDAARAASEGPSIFTAIEEQLGMKLESRKVPVDVFIVDRLQKVPTEN